MQENKRLGIFGIMNYEMLKDMTMDERKLAVTNRAKEVLSICQQCAELSV